MAGWVSKLLLLYARVGQREGPSSSKTYREKSHSSKAALIGYISLRKADVEKWKNIGGKSPMETATKDRSREPVFSG